MKYKITLILLFTTTLTQAQNLTQSIEQQITNARQNESTSAIDWSNYENEAMISVITPLQAYTQDSSRSVRLKSYDLLFQISLAVDSVQDSTADVTVQQGMELFLRGLNDEDNGIQGFVADRLRSFEAEMYTEDMRKLLIQKLNPRPFYYEELVLTLAYINEDSSIDLIIDDLRTQSNELSQMERWQAHIALARLGEEPALNFIVRKASELPESEDAVYEIYPSLAFTRQKEAVDVLVELVYSDEQNCSSPDPDSNRKITCAYRILEMIAPIIQDFPVAVDEATGDLDTENYEEALKTSREWLNANRSVYTLIN
ncbi:hypothetical protein QYS48_31325 [Marivirga arenosa]|uniref:HEAT repeat domain-containing protein n=1 Tax=Marivirga arenosa TaxID=3059076 RepID=A0AA51R7X3_9BACT|nr:hypothetical protein [Marivirga sp. ABR2-2]WMN06021.1 hypothetical protein QYS48_31325 [Marivirga sp. ABR2-2]